MTMRHTRTGSWIGAALMASAVAVLAALHGGGAVHARAGAPMAIGLDEGFPRADAPLAAADPAAPAPVAATPQAAPVAGTSAGNAPDLWAFMLAGRGSDDPARVLESRRALQLCVSLESSGDDVRTFLGGGRATLPGVVTPERQLAYQALLAKCAGFRALTGPQVDALVREFPHRDAELLAAEESAFARSDLTSLERLAFSGGPAATAEALPLLALAAARAQGLDARDEALREDLGAAGVLASCELGTDCTSGGFDAQHRCVFEGACGGPAAGELAPERAARIAHWRLALVDAVQRRDLSGLGLHDDDSPGAPL